MKVLGVVHPSNRRLGALHCQGDKSFTASLAVGLASLLEYLISLFEMSEGGKREEGGSRKVNDWVSALATCARKALSRHHTHGEI